MRKIGVKKLPKSFFAPKNISIFAADLVRGG